MNKIEFVIKSKDEIRRAGLSGYYVILDKNGVNPYTNVTRDEYIKNGYVVLNEDEFDELIKEFENSICGNWCEITQKFYEYALNVLPPIRWHDGGFYSCEADCGDVNAFYQEYEGKYYTSLQHLSTKRADIMNDLKSAINAGRVKDRTKDFE